jgi:hypothetical protein
MNSSTATVTSIVPTMQTCLTQSTAEWLCQLYDSGAVTFMPDGSVTLDEEVSKLISALHAVLSGGEVKVDIIRSGGNAYDRLENAFSKAWRDSNIAFQYALNDDVVTMVP